MNSEPIFPKYQSLLKDESGISGTAEEVVFAENTDDVCSALQYANKNRLCVTVQGARTGLVGGAVPKGGLVLNLSKMNKILDDNIKNKFLKVLSGVTLQQIEDISNSNGLFFAPNPTEKTATIGGAFASGASGPNCLLYGDSSQYIHKLSWVTPQGELWNIERGKFTFNNNKCLLPNGSEILIDSKLPHSPVKIAYDGMDLIDFLSGSEGFLGVATEFEIELLKSPKEIWGVVYFFNNLEQTLSFLNQLFDWNSDTQNAKLMVLEFYDKNTLELLDVSRKSSPLLKSLPNFPNDTCYAVYTEISSDSSDDVEEALMQHLDMFVDAGGQEENTWAESGNSAIQRFRDMRHAVPELINENMNNTTDFKARWETDFCGMPERFVEFLKEYYDVLSNYKVNALVYGHILKNKLHVALLPQTIEENDLCNEIIDVLAERVMLKEGYLISENGVGLLKIPLVEKFFDNKTIDNINQIRLAFDPNKCMKNFRREE